MAEAGGWGSPVGTLWSLSLDVGKSCAGQPQEISTLVKAQSGLPFSERGSSPHKDWALGPEPGIAHPSVSATQLSASAGGSHVVCPAWRGLRPPASQEVGGRDLQSNPERGTCWASISPGDWPGDPGPGPQPVSGAEARGAVLWACKLCPWTLATHCLRTQNCRFWIVRDHREPTPNP